MRIAVTGANGFVGGAIVRRLAAIPETEVIGVVRRPGTLPPQFERFRFDIAAPFDTRERPIPPADALIHAAALAHRFGGAPDSEFERINAQGTRRVCRLAREMGARRLVLVSSVSVYGSHGAEAVGESAECRPAPGYGASKLAAERIATEEWGPENLWVLRLATVVGEGDPGNTARLITKIIDGRFVMIGKGENKKTFVAVDDVARIASALAVRPGGGVFNVAAEPVRVGEVVGTIREAAGLGPVRVRIPERAARYAGRAAAMTGIRRGAAVSDLISKWFSEDRYSGELLARVTGLRPEIAALDAIRAETLAMIGRKR